MTINILIIGSGAREHALAVACKRSQQTTHLFCYSNYFNPGIRSLTTEYWLGDLADGATIVRYAPAAKITFAIIGPEAPLEKGVADALWAVKIPTIGPQQRAAKIE